MLTSWSEQLFLETLEYSNRISTVLCNYGGYLRKVKGTEQESLYAL